MHGNVFEWCQDRYGRYSIETAINPQGSKIASSTCCVVDFGSSTLEGRVLFLATGASLAAATTPKPNGALKASGSRLTVVQVEHTGNRWEMDSGVAKNRKIFLSI